LDTFDEKLAAQQEEEEAGDDSEKAVDTAEDTVPEYQSNEEMSEHNETTEPLAGDEGETKQVKLSAKEIKLQKRKEKLAQLKEKRKAANQEEMEKKATEAGVADQNDDTETKCNRPSLSDVDQGAEHTVHMLSFTYAVRLTHALQSRL
jgi:hypothetical protein